jgi:hypothetical protein
MEGLVEEFSEQGSDGNTRSLFAEDAETDALPVRHQTRDNLWDDPDEDEDIGDGIFAGGEHWVQVYNEAG